MKTTPSLNIATLPDLHGSPTNAMGNSCWSYISFALAPAVKQMVFYAGHGWVHLIGAQRKYQEGEPHL